MHFCTPVALNEDQSHFRLESKFTSSEIIMSSCLKDISSQTSECMLELKVFHTISKAAGFLLINPLPGTEIISILLLVAVKNERTTGKAGVASKYLLSQNLC